jgi:hypothetical protein
MKTGPAIATSVGSTMTNNVDNHRGKLERNSDIAEDPVAGSSDPLLPTGGHSARGDQLPYQGRALFFQIKWMKFR